MSSSRSASGANTPVHHSEFGDKAAEIIQRHFRGFKDRLKVREKAAFNISQLIEYSEEQDHLNLNKFFMRWIKLIKNKENQDITRYVSSSIKDDLSQLNENDIKIEANYQGPHLSDQFNRDDFHKLLNSFKNNQILHTKYAIMILNKAIESLKQLPNVNEISCLESDALAAALNNHSISNGQTNGHTNGTVNGNTNNTINTNSNSNNNNSDFRVNVVGDLHGQFIDLCKYFFH